MKLTLSKIVLPVAAVLLVGWWIVRGSDDRATSASDSASSAPPVPVATNGTAINAATRPTGKIPGYSAPPIENATPAEVAALVQAEVERSARSEPPKSFVGIDGKPKAFEYNKAPESAAREEARDERRKLLMQQLNANPQRFARDNQLTLKEVQWIVDGTSDFPDRLLD